MRINNIQLINIGPYLGSNTLEFNPNGNSKNIVLIGGKNGTGKTSLFNAVKICIYGCKAYGYEKENQVYYSDILRIINSQEKLKNEGIAKVVTDITLEDGKKDSMYSLKRMWTLDGKKVQESFSVSRDGQEFCEKEKSDFEKYIFQLIPPDLFKFYFFDGEKISDFIFDDTRHSDFKNAFLKLCGLDTLELILINFRRIYRGSSSKSNLAAEYERVRTEKVSINELINAKSHEKTENAHESVKVDEEIALLENSYSDEGGVDIDTWNSMHDELSKEDSVRTESRKWLKDIANNVLPFVILSEQLNEVKTQIELESKVHSENIVRQEINNPRLANKLLDIFNNLHIEHPEDLTRRVIDEIIITISDDETLDCTEYLSLSPREKLELIAKINSLLAFDTERIKKTTKAIAKSLSKTDSIRKKINQLTVNDFGSFLSAKNALIERKSLLLSESTLIEKELLDLISKDMQIDSEFKKIKTLYEEELKSKSIKDISARAILAFEELQSKLYENFISQVENEFKETFSTLINENDLMDGVLIDDFLRIVPYKNTSFRRSEVIRLKKKFGEEYLVSLLGVKAFAQLNAFLNGNDDECTLPVEVQQQLSAGEKQIFIMAIYKALAGLNKISVPYIIDTPFARIDAEHRMKILKEFFMKLPGQVIILSTDEEIVGRYKEAIESNISSTFKLSHEKGGITRITSNDYFGG